jgi:HAD superfamily hydrolase (TIGR01509 family)
MTGRAPEPPYAAITTLFVDVGNTLVSMDSQWIRDELAGCGVHTSVAAIERAEAAARPAVSARITQHSEGNPHGLFGLYFASMLEELEARAEPLAVPVAELVTKLVPVLRAPGRTARLWSRLLPGVTSALDQLKALELKLVIVSNSDGTIEELLREQGLRDYFDDVLDSAVVGFEKPDVRIFEAALARAACAPEATLHVGDMYHADVAGARAASLHAVLLDPFGDWADVDCHRVESFAALAERLAASR